MVYLARRGRPTTLTLRLIHREDLTHDTQKLTFALPRRHLGLQVGQHIQVQYSPLGRAPTEHGSMVRPYTPISPPDQRDTVTLLIKVYRPCPAFLKGGVVSQYLGDLPLHSPLTVTLPFGHIIYRGAGEFRMGAAQTTRHFTHVYMVGGGTGITPLYQVIQHISEREPLEQRPHVSLLFANRTPSDILLRDELLGLANANPRLRCAFSVDKAEGDWTGMVGFVDVDKIRKTIPDQVEHTLFLSCGPPPMCNAVENFLRKEFKVSIQNIYRF